jgi:hypothetical protein
MHPLRVALTKIVSKILYVAFLAGLTIGVAGAAPVTVTMIGHVTGVTDPAARLGGQVSAGQTVAVTYTYDTITPDQEPDPTLGYYEPLPSQGASFSVAVGGLTFASNATSLIAHSIADPLQPNGWDTFESWYLASLDNEPLANGTSIDMLVLWLLGGTGTALASDALLTTAPDVEAFQHRNLNVVGAGGEVEVLIEIDSAELVP